MKLKIQNQNQNWIKSLLTFFTIKMKIKDLKKLLKEFDDEDEVLVEGVIHSAGGHEDWGTKELEENDIQSSQYDGKTRMIITVY